MRLRRELKLRPGVKIAIPHSRLVRGDLDKAQQIFRVKLLASDRQRMHANASP